MVKRGTWTVALFASLLVGLTASAADAESPRTVIINEVAWGGASWDHTAEWIELLNASDESVNVNGWRLISSDGSPNVPLHGVLAPGRVDPPSDAFLLLERRDDLTVPDVPANVIYAGALDDGGEALFLLDAEGRIVDSANAPTAPGAVSPWPAGFAEHGPTPHGTMERVDIDLGDVASNWSTWREDDVQTPSSSVYGGTPGSSNSVFNIPPVASFTHDPSLPRPGESVHFDATSSADASDEIISYHWSFGDRHEGEGAFVDHTFPEAGRYDVTLTVVDGSGAETSITRLVRVMVTHPPSADFSVLPSYPDRSYHVQDLLGFQDESNDIDGDLVSWEWTFGDGFHASGESVFHPYDIPGEYTVALEVTDDQGEWALQSQSISVLSRPPIVHFTFEPEHPNQGEAVRFDASSSWDPDGAIAIYRWDFDSDGVTDLESMDAIIEYAFAEPGEYTPNLGLLDDAGVPSYPPDDADVPFSEPPVVRVNTSPISIFSVSCFDPTETQTVSFTDASFDPDGTLVSWAWSFGDGSRSEDPSPSHAYSASGPVTLSLTVTDDNGATHTTEATLDVGNLSPLASLTVDKTTSPTGAAFRFDASDSVDPSPDGAIVEYAWDFEDDGTYDQTTAACTVSHSYADDGTYAVRCQVTDDDGATAVSDSLRVVVTNRPPRVTRVSWAPEIPTDGQEVAFSGAADDPDGEVVRWVWGFGDGADATDREATHAFANNQSYAVTLTVEDDDGGQSEPYSFEVSVANALPMAILSATSVGYRTVAFDSLKSYDPSPNGEIVHVAWHFGDGTSCPGTPSACGDTGRATPTHFYSAPGTYIVTLVVVDDQGGLSTAEQTITVRE